MMGPMAVYTHLSDQAIRRHMRSFRVGEVVKSKGIAAGTINTIYEITTTQGRFILRILEDRSPTEARYEEALLLHLKEKGLMVPKMLRAGRRGHIIPLAPRQQLSLFEYLPGRELAVFELKPVHCQQVGSFLASMHLATEDFKRRKKNRFAPRRVMRIADQCIKAAERNSSLSRRDVEEMVDELRRHEWSTELPTGVIHGDLFIDNVRFTHDELCGVLDFEMASSGPLVYDIAVAICDWAFLHDKILVENAIALVAGYEEHRPLNRRERAALHDFCMYAVARFALTRFFDFEVHQRPEANRRYKDYRHFLARMRALRSMGPENFVDLVCLTA